VESDDESEGEEEERETEEEGHTVAEHVMPPAVLNTVDKAEVPTVATLADNNTDDGAKKVQEEPGVAEVELQKATVEEKQEFVVPEKCADDAEAEISSPGQCCESGSEIRIRRLFDPGFGISFFRIRNRFFLNPGSQTHIFDSLMTNFGQKVIQPFLAILQEKISSPVQK
jgi:hypothetical protein